MESPTRGEALLDLLLPNAGELMGEVRIGGSLGGHNHILVEFSVFRGKGRVTSGVRTLNFRQANFFWLIRVLVHGSLGKVPLETKE